MDDALLLPEENADIVSFIQNYVDGPGAQDPWLSKWTWQEMEHCDRFVMSYVKSFQCENTFADADWAESVRVTLYLPVAERVNSTP